MCSACPASYCTTCPAPSSPPPPSAVPNRTDSCRPPRPSPCHHSNPRSLGRQDSSFRSQIDSGNDLTPAPPSPPCCSPPSAHSHSPFRQWRLPSHHARSTPASKYTYYNLKFVCIPSGLHEQRGPYGSVWLRLVQGSPSPPQHHACTCRRAPTGISLLLPQTPPPARARRLRTG